MTIERDHSTYLSVDGVTIERRDIEMLEAIERRGSMHGAADELGRSYARLQNRIVELEEAVGRLTERRRGGSGGGGTELTDAAHDLRTRFDRLDTALEGVAQVSESVFIGTVRDRTGELATVMTEAGEIMAVAPEGASEVEVAVRSDAVVLTEPGAAPDADGTSLRNTFTGTIAAVDAGEAVANVTVDLGCASVQALVTMASVDRLDLEPGQEIRTSFKATAARAITADPARTS